MYTFITSHRCRSPNSSRSCFSGSESALSNIRRYLPLSPRYAVVCFSAKRCSSARQAESRSDSSEKPYISRAGLVTMLDYFITPENAEEIYSLLDCVHSENYYVKMAVSWLLSVLLVKCYDSAVSVFENRRYDKFIHNKAIRKSSKNFLLLLLLLGSNAFFWNRFPFICSYIL